MIFKFFNFDLNKFIRDNRSSKCAEIDVDINDGNALITQELILKLYGEGALEQRTKTQSN